MARTQRGLAGGSGSRGRRMPPLATARGARSRRGWRRQAAEPTELGLVGCEFGTGGQLLVHQQVSDFLELALLGDVEDVVAAVVQDVGRAPDGAQRRAARG